MIIAGQVLITRLHAQFMFWTINCIAAIYMYTDSQLHYRMISVKFIMVPIACRCQNLQKDKPSNQVCKYDKSTWFLRHHLSMVLDVNIISWKKLQLAEYVLQMDHGIPWEAWLHFIELMFNHALFPCLLHQLKTKELEMVLTRVLSMYFLLMLFWHRDHVPHLDLN